MAPVVNGQSGPQCGQKADKFESTSLPPWMLLISILTVACVAAAVGTSRDEGNSQPPTRRRRRRNRAERGLPERDALCSLARTYLEIQHRLWPQLQGKQYLPEISDAAIEALADLFTQTFMSNTLDVFEIPANTVWDSVAASYVRYSCDNSNPRSLDQQLRLILEEAQRNNQFIPWNYIFADAAVTGTTSARIGYQLAKTAIESEKATIATLFIDEVGRAARDMIEALTLGRLIEGLDKRLLGVSDKMDTKQPMWKYILSMFAMIHESFIVQLRSKVQRGMKDAFRKGTNVGLPAVGYLLVDAVDEHGRTLMNKHDKPQKVLAIDEDTAKYVRLAFKLYAEKKWTLIRIAKHFNARCVGGQQSWDGSRIRSLLQRWKYVGINVYGMKHQSVDPITGDVHTTRHPRNEWLVKRARHLQIISWKLWKKVQKRLAEVRAAYAQTGHSFRKRCEVNPTLLVRPICSECGNPMWIGRSGKYASLTCLAGMHGKHGCSFKGYKSVNIIETVVVNHLQNEVLTEEHVIDLVAKANEFLLEEADKPQQDVAPLKQELQQTRRKANRLTNLIEEAEEDALSTLVQRLKQHEKRIKELNDEISLIEVQNDVPEQIDISDVREHLKDLCGLLRQDVAVAAPVLSQLTGPIVVHQKKERGKKKPTWFAKFTVNLVPAMLELAREKNCPTTRSLEYLATASWTMEKECEVRCEQVPTYERIATEAMEMQEAGASIETIARATESSWVTVREALEFKAAGVRPAPKPTGKKTRKRKGPPKYQAIATEVAKRRASNESFAKIATDLKVAESTVTRAYDFLHPKKLRDAALEGKTPDRS